MCDSNENGSLVYLSTGIDTLDGILSMDAAQRGAKGKGGIFIGPGQDRRKLETPIVLISGTTGTGKTTLALQMAFCAATDDWLPFFYALEQSTQSLRHLAVNFGGFEEYQAAEENQVTYDPSAVAGKLCDLADPESEICFEKYQASEEVQATCDSITVAGRLCESGDLESNICSKKATAPVYRCYLSPRPISEVPHQTVFEERFVELRHMVETVDDRAGNRLAVFFIDSLNAFSSLSLGRAEIYRLYSLFRNHHIPAVLTVEQHQHNGDGTESPLLESARFLADIAISLTKDSSREYQQYCLEVEKSRVSRQGLGKHLYKIRTRNNAKGIELDPRTGIVLYPSVHSVLSRAGKKGPKDREFLICKDPGDDLALVLANTRIRTRQCLTIIGPPGTHKLALGMNLAMGYDEQRPSRLLVVNFGGSGVFQFSGVAWTKRNELYRSLRDPNEDKDRHGGMKFWCRDYVKAETDDKKARATVLTFRIGQLTPEECVFVIRSVIERAADEECPFSSVLLSDTGELCSGFPLLVYDPLFLPALVDIFSSHNLVTVCIGVDTPHPIRNTEINFALSSRADYRIVMSHYPDKSLLNEGILDRVKYPRSGLIKEQLVSLVIDNVTGKHYGREPRWLWVEVDDDDNKTLHCALSPHLHHPKFEICREEDDFFFRLSDADGRPILVGEGTVCGSGCVRQVTYTRESAPLKERYKRSEVGEKLRFDLVDSNGNVIGHSQEFDTEAQYDQAIRLVMRMAPDVPLEDPIYLGKD